MFGEVQCWCWILALSFIGGTSDWIFDEWMGSLEKRTWTNSHKTESQEINSCTGDEAYLYPERVKATRSEQ